MPFPPTNAAPALRPLMVVLLLLLLAGRAAAAGGEMAPLRLTAQQHEYDVATFSQYLVDPGGRLRIEQLLHPREERPWQPLKGTTSSFGFSDAAIWFRFDILNDDTSDADYFIEIHYPLLDEIEFYLLRQGKVAETITAGDKLPFAARPFAFRNFLFKPPLPPGERVSVYIRVRSESSLFIPLRLWHDHDFYIHEQREVMGHGLYFGVLIVFALYNLMLLIFTHERATAYHTLYIVSFGLFHAGMFGLGYQYLWTGSPFIQHYSVPLFMLLSLFTALRFAHHFLGLKEHCPKGVRVLQTISLLSLLLIVALPLLSYGQAIQLGLVLVVLGASLLLLASFTVWRRIRGDAGYFFFAWAIFLLTVIASASDKFGLGGPGSLADHLVQLGVIVQIAIFTLAQARRVQEEKEQRLAIQQQTAAELTRLVHERTEELEQANRRLDAMSHTDGLTGLSNRRRFDDELERQFKAAARKGTTISLAMLDIDHFKRINDRYGHQVGDDYLRLIAAVIAAEVKRPLDSACRYGGEEFALILPETRQEGAASMAECIRTGVAAIRHRVGEEWVPVTISIGTATVTPERHTTAEALIRLADQALYQAKAQGRNRVVSC